MKRLVALGILLTFAAGIGVRQLERQSLVRPMATSTPISKPHPHFNAMTPKPARATSIVTPFAVSPAFAWLNDTIYDIDATHARAGHALQPRQGHFSEMTRVFEDIGNWGQAQQQRCDEWQRQEGA